MVYGELEEKFPDEIACKIVVARACLPYLMYLLIYQVVPRLKCFHGLLETRFSQNILVGYKKHQISKKPICFYALKSPYSK